MKLFPNNNTTFLPFAFSPAKNHLKKQILHILYDSTKKKKNVYYTRTTGRVV